MQNHSGNAMTDNATIPGMSDHAPGHVMAVIGTAELAAEATLLVCSMLLAVAANSLMCAVLYRRRRSMSPSYLLLLNMAAAGLVFAVCVMPLHAYTVFSGDDWSGYWVCTMDGHVIAVCSLATLLTHVFIAITRCVTVTAPVGSCMAAVVHSRGVFAVVASWTLAVLLDVVGTASDVIHPGYSAIYRTCTPIDMLDMDGVLISLLAVVGIPFGVMCYCYVKLVLTIRRQAKMATLKGSSSSEGRRLQQFVAVTRTLIVLSVLFVAGWLPMLIVCSSDRDHSRFRMTWHRLSHDGAEVTSCLYPFFCLLCVAELRDTAWKLFGSPKNNKVTPNQTPSWCKVRKSVMSGNIEAVPLPRLLLAMHNHQVDCRRDCPSINCQLP